MKPSNSEAVQNTAFAGYLGVATHSHVLCPCPMGFCCCCWMPEFSVRFEDSWPLLPPRRGVFTHSTTLSRGQPPRDFFTRITQFLGHHSEYCATALLVAGPLPQGISQYRLQLRCLHEAFPYLRLRYRLQLVASTRRFHSYHTFYGHHPGMWNCPVSSCPFAAGVSLFRYRLQLHCLHEGCSYLRLRYRLQLVASISPWGVFIS